MRNTTKLKLLLKKYTVTFNLDENDGFELILTDKDSNDMHLFEAESYSKSLAKAYSFLLKELKKSGL